MTEPAKELTLPKETSEASQLWVPRGDVRVCTVSVEGESELRVSLAVGSSIALRDGGSAAAALQGRIGPEGWVESISQRTVGLASVSAPVHVHGEPVAAVCVIVPVPRMNTSPGQMFGSRVVAAAAAIASAAGGEYRPR
jgi:DNA-binding IclR family transcriptional regulator